MFDLLELVGWPPSVLTGGLVLLFSLAYGTQARTKLRPMLLAAQVGIICLVSNALIESIMAEKIWPSDLIKALLSQTFGTLFGLTIIGWLIIRFCFIFRFRNAQTNIFTRNRRS